MIISTCSSHINYNPNASKYSEDWFLAEAYHVFAGKWASDNLKLVEGYSARRSVAKVLFRSEVNDYHGEKVLAK